MKRVIGITASMLLILSASVFAGEHKECRKTVDDCLNSMVEKLRSTGFIGVELEAGCKQSALKVSKVIQGSPAEKAGIQIGDELYAINGIRFSKQNTKSISKVKVPGKAVTCTIRRNGAEKQVSVTLTTMPEELIANYVGQHMLQHVKHSKEAVANK